MNTFFNAERSHCIFVSVLICLVLMAGCARTIKIIAVDADTGRPISGVAVSWREDYRDPCEFNNFLNVVSDDVTAPSRPAKIKLKGMKRNGDNHFIFAASGYANVFGCFESPDLGLADSFSYTSNIPWMLASERITKTAEQKNDSAWPKQSNEWFLAGTVTIAIKTNGYFILPMHPLR